MRVVQSIVLALGIAGALATVGSLVVSVRQPSVASLAASEDASRTVPLSGPDQAAADAARHLAESPVQQPHEPPPCSVLGALPESADYVVVYECYGSPSDFAVVAVDAPNVDDVVTAAVRSLGHVPDDAVAGLSTVFEPSHIDTATVTVTGSEAAVSLPSAFVAGGYGRSSALHRSVLEQLSLTVFANSTVEVIRFELEGSCQAFWDEMESPENCYRAERIDGWSALTGVQAYEFVTE